MPRRRKRKYTQWSDYEKAIAQSKWNDGYAISQIAAELGCTVVDVYSLVQRERERGHTFELRRKPQLDHWEIDRVSIDSFTYMLGGFAEAEGTGPMRAGRPLHQTELPKLKILIEAGLSYDQIARKMNRPEGTLRSWRSLYGLPKIKRRRGQ